MKKALFFIVALLFMTATQLQAQVSYYYVSTTGNDANPGTMAQPFKTIERALNMCVYNPPRTYYIQVEEGVYVIDRVLKLTPYTIIEGGHPIGFNGTPFMFPCNSYIEPAPGYDGPLMEATNPAIGTTSGIYLSFRNGNNSNGNGGALFIENCSPYVKHCGFYNCSALQGGAVYCENSNSPFYENKIAECTAKNGGGIYSVNSDLYFLQCIFSLNRSVYDGGALCNINSIIRMEGGSLAENSSSDGSGGAILQKIGELLLNNVDIFYNVASVSSPQSFGGGIFLERVPYALMEKCHFTGNKADFGGAIYSRDSQLKIIENNIQGNLAAYAGGGIYNIRGDLYALRTYFQLNMAENRGGALFNQSSFAKLEMCLLTHNGASLYEGSAIMNEASDLILDHVTVADNGARAIFNTYQTTETLTISKSIIWGNGNGSLSDNLDHYAHNPNLVNVWCSDIQDVLPWNFNICGYYDASTIDTDPRFVAFGDYHLRRSSPAIDPRCSDNMADYVDIESTPMFGPSFDMGCYEYVSLSPRGKGVASAEEGIFTIYPNPVNRGSVLNISLDEEMKEEGEVTVELYSILGSRVLQTTTSDRSISLPEHIAPGQYFLRIYSTDYTKVRSAKVLVR